MEPRSCGTDWCSCPAASRHTTTLHTRVGLTDHAIEYFRRHRMPFKALRDGQVLITQAAPRAQDDTDGQTDVRSPWGKPLRAFR